MNFLFPLINPLSTPPDITQNVPRNTACESNPVSILASANHPSLNNQFTTKE